MMNKKLTLILVLCLFGLTACIKPFQPPVQQGNIINNSSLKEIRYGMTKQEVLYILGTPMITDPFNEERWDYFYSRKDRNKNQTTTRLVTAMFKDNKLVELKGDVDLSNLDSLEPSKEDRHNGGTVITEPTQPKKGILSGFRLFGKKKR